MAPSTVYKDVKGSKEKSREERSERLLLCRVKEKEEIGVTKWEKYDSYSSAEEQQQRFMLMFMGALIKHKTNLIRNALNSVT